MGLRTDLPPEQSPTVGSDLGALDLPYSAAETEALRIRGELDEGIRPKDKWQQFYYNTLLTVGQEAPIGVPYLNAEDLSVGSIQRYIVQKQAEDTYGGMSISEDEANKRYPWMPRPFVGAQNPIVADIKAREELARAKYRNYVSKGGDVPWYSSLASGAILGLDPLNVLAGYGVGKAFRALKIPETFGNTYLENFLGNVLVDMPNAAIRRTEGQEASYGQALVDAASGAALMTGITKTLGWMWSRGMQKLGGVSPDQIKTSQDLAVVQAAHNRKVNVTPLLEGNDPRQQGGVTPGTELPPSGTGPTGTYFSIVDSQGRPGGLLGSSHGGRILIEDFSAAKNRAADLNQASGGKIDTHQITEELKILDYNAKLSEVPSLRDRLKETLDDNTFRILDPTSDRSFGEFIQYAEDLSSTGLLNPKIVEQIDKVVQDSGYDAIRVRGNSFTGKPLSQIHLLNEAKVKLVESKLATSDGVPTILRKTRDDLATKLDDPKNSIHYSDRVQKILDSIRTAPTKESLDQIVQEVSDFYGTKIKAYMEMKKVSEEILARDKPIKGYHGTPVAYEKAKIDPDNPDLLVGPGFYVTEDPSIAAGYAGNGTLSPNFSKVTTNLINMPKGGELFKKVSEDFSSPIFSSQFSNTWMRRLVREIGDWYFFGKHSIENTIDQIYEMGKDRAEYSLKQIEVLNEEKKAGVVSKQTMSGPIDIDDLILQHHMQVKLEKDIVDLIPDVVKEVASIFDKETTTPNIRVAHLNIKNPFDMDAVISPASVKKINLAIEKWLSGAPEELRIQNFLNEFEATKSDTILEELFDEIEAGRQMDGWDYLKEIGIINGPAQPAVRDLLKEAGFDGITHQGGVMGGKKHRVWVAFDESQILDEFTPEGKQFKVDFTKEVKAIKEGEKRLKDEIQAFKAFADCIKGSLT